ncbi:dipeptidyl peptidase III [Aspergillus heteromorphus CBS 117.55]|uniref:Dipeptidyl peptidase 3 n=1 Tax=Aspergillus heteromorphus CBS 117.55 TaxID=1448321 RepID=A0A317W8I4_9EURO|nr:dipeptidyl peptidase III [Aspergillus heteromorphus CBS 117.55]PWY82924.1 dipeptidyl peptidase III [Aspergillus heteromorphus CBS 117.55]
MPTPQIYQLSISPAFASLSAQEKLYAHHLAKAAWNSTRIILRQVSPEATGIFDFIISLYRSCDGNWEQLAAESGVDIQDVERFLDYAATFLSNVGNYYGSGDQKFTPDVTGGCLEKLAGGSSSARKLLEEVKGPMLDALPQGLGRPGPLTQSAYYLGADCLDSAEDVAVVARVMEEQSILPENTRLRRIGADCYDIMQASITEGKPLLQTHDSNGTKIYLAKGDHKNELSHICDCLQAAIPHASSPAQTEMLQKIIDSFQTGDLEAYRASQRIWVKDKAPPVESVFGFVEPYRDPLGVRAEFEGIVGIPDPGETRILNNLASRANTLVYKLPWVDGDEDGAKGPFEKELFEPPDFSSIHSLVYCSSIIFPGINLPNYNDIRQETGYKNIIFSNRMIAESNRARGIHMVDEQEQSTFKNHRFHAYYIWVVLHEILGHGTGKFLTESSDGSLNFDQNQPPVDPLTGNPVNSWYRPGQTWTGVFNDLATTVDECRAELVGAYLIDDLDILRIFGYTAQSEVTPDDIAYNMYLQLGVDGLRGLENYDPTTKKWGQAHSRAHFSMLRHLLRDSDGLYTVLCDMENTKLTVKVDRSRVISHGKPSLGRMLLKLHIYRCTADISNCRLFYEDLSHVDEEALRWRDIVVSKKDPPLAFSQANTFLEGGDVKLKEYAPTARGIIQSWAEREIE